MANEQTPQGTPSVFEFWDNMKTKSLAAPAAAPTNPAPDYKSKTTTPIKVTNTGIPSIKDWNSKISEIANTKVDPLRFSQPSQFGAGSEGFNLKRYYAHPDVDILGLNPSNFDSEQYYNENGTVGSDFIRMAKYLPSTMWGFTKDYLKPYRHPSDLFDATPDIEGAKAYQDGMSIMMSSKPGFAGSSVNFFANLAPTLGITAGVLTEELALFGAKTVGSRLGLTAATKPLDAAAARNLLRIPSLLQKGKNVKTALSAFAKADNINKVRMLWEGRQGLGGIKGAGIGFAKEVNPFKNTLKGLDEANDLNGILALSTSVGGAYADLQRIRFGINEAQTEGGGAILERIESGRQEYGAVQQKKIASITKEMQSLVNQNNEVTDKNRYEQLYNELTDAKQKLSTGPTGEDASKILTIAEQNGKAVTLINLPIIYMTNAFGFEKIIGHGTVKRSLADQFVKNYNKHLVKSTIAGAAGKASYELIENNIKKWGKKAYLKHAMMQTPGRLLDYLGKNVPEGVQELFQEGAIKGVDHYYTTKFQDPIKFHKGIMGESILVGANSQYSKEGLEVFAQGLLSGGAIYTGTSLVKSVANPVIELGKKTWHGKENYEQYAQELNDQANRVLTAAQKAADDPAEFYKLFDKAGGEQINYARVGHVAEALSDEKDQRDIRNDATISYVHTLSQAGRLDVLIDNLKDMRNLNAEELANALGEDYVEADQAKYFSRLEKSIRNVEDLGERFEKFREVMPNKYNPSSINKFSNPEAYAAEVNNYNAHEEATFFAVYSSKTFEETLDRLQGIQEKFNAIPSFSRMPGMRASKIFSVSQMQDDVKSLRTQAKINEENGDIKTAKRLTREADNLENLANASSIYSTLLSLAGKSTLTAEEKKELEAARKSFVENLEKKNAEDETEFTLDDLTSQDSLDEYRTVLKSAFDKYFSDMTTSNNVRPFLAEELNDMFTMYNDWHSLGTDNRNMARWVNMLTDPSGFNEFKNNIGYSLKRVHEKRNDILREQKKKFMKGMIQNAFLKALFEQQGVFVSVDDIEAFEKNDRYPTLIDAKTLQPIKGNDLRIPAIEEMFDNYEKVYNKVVKERPIRQAAAELGLLEEYFSFAHKKKNGQDNRTVQDYANELGIDAYGEAVVSMDDLCNFIINSKFATSAEKKLAQKILSLNKGDMKVTIRPNHSVPISHDPKNGLIIDFRYASSNYKDNDYRAEYLVLKGMMMSLTTDFLQDEEFAAEVEEMMDAVKAAAQTDPSLLDDFGGKIPLGMSSPVSFINEVMTNPQFQALLIQVKSTRTPKESTFTQVINSIKKFIKKAFKIKSSDDNVLKQAVALVGLTIDQTDYLQKPGERRKSPAMESVEEPKDEVLEEVAIEEEETTTPEETPVAEPTTEEVTTETITETTTEEIPEVIPSDEIVTEEDIDKIDINTPVDNLPKDLSDLLYDAYKKVSAVAKIKESNMGFRNFVQTNPKAVTIIENWKKSKAETPVEEKPEEPKPLDFQQIRDELFARGWLPEDINGLTEDQVTALHSTGTTKEQALAQFQADAEFAEADKKVQALIKKLSDSFKASGVTKVEGGYEKDGNKVARVSDIVRDILAKKFTNTTAANRGNVLDPIFRDFFDGKLTTPEQVKQKLEELSGKVDSESGEKMMQYSATFPSALYNTMVEVKQYLNGKGLKIIGSIPTLFGDIAGPRAGEIDFLVYDKEGNLGIIDLKTSTRNLVDSYNDPADEFQYERGHTIQQLAYRELIRQATGEDITDIYILPIQLSTNSNGVVRSLNSLNTGTEEKPSILLKLNTSRDIFEVTGYGRPAGSEVTRTQEEEDALVEAEKAKQQKRIDALTDKLSKLRGEQVAAIASGNLVKINDLNQRIKKIVDELKLYGIAVEDVIREPEVVETEEVTKAKPEVGMIIKLNDGRIVKVKKVSKKQVTVVPLNDEDAIGEVLDESLVDDIDKMVVSPGKKKKAPAPKPETEEVMNESKSNAETLANDKDAQAKLASEAEKMSTAQAQNNFLNNLKNRCE